jgi:hypothetical protein
MEVLPVIGRIKLCFADIHRMIGLWADIAAMR